MVGVPIIYVEALESIVQGVKKDAKRACVPGDGGGSEARLANRVEVPLVWHNMSYSI